LSSTLNNASSLNWRDQANALFQSTLAQNAHWR
jgi:hypothetical protein